jgi:hypothetical protein
MDSGKAEVKIGDLKISTQDDRSKQEAYIYFGLAVACLIGGLVLVRGKAS